MARKISVELVGDATSLERSFKRAGTSATGFERSIGHATRGAAAGSGAFRSLGRSLAFASAGFIGFATATDVLKKSIDAATEAAATQKQLAAQFRSSGQNLGNYRAQIEETSNRLSKLAGFTRDDLTQSFITAFRGSKDVTASLRIQAVAADVARGRHIELSAATLALTKAYGGQATALRRLGILVPKNLTGLQALEFVSRRFAGQAQAGTTAQQRFGAALHNTAETLGTALLPTFNKLLTSATKWLGDTRNQVRIQKDATKGAKDLAAALGLVAKAAGGVSAAVKVLNPLLGPLWKVTQFASPLNFIPAYLKAFKHPSGGTAGLVPPGVLSEQRMPLRNATFGGATPGASSSRRQGASLAYQLSLNSLTLAKAEQTSGKADDRAALVLRVALLKRVVAKTKDLAKRIQFNQDLASAESQITQIDQDAASKVKTARDKQIAAEKKKAAEAKAQHAKLVQIAQQQAADVKTATQNMRQAFSTALGTVQGVIGTLFQGPTLAGETQAQHLAAAGVPGTTAKGLTGDVVAQTAQARRFYNDLTKLKKLGASKGLLSSLVSQGTAAIPQIETLLKSPGQAKQFIKAFGAQEKFAARIAAMNVTANRVTISAKDRQPVVVYLTLDGKVVSKVVTAHQHRTRRNSAPGVRGTGQEIGSWAFQ